MLDRRADHRARPAGRPTPRTARLSASVPPPVKTMPPGATPRRGGDDVPRLVDRGPGRPGHLVGPGRVAEPLGQPRQHGVGRLRTERTGGGVIEVDEHERFRLPGPRRLGLHAMRPTEPVATSGVAIVSPQDHGFGVPSSPMIQPEFRPACDEPAAPRPAHGSLGRDRQRTLGPALRVSARRACRSRATPSARARSAAGHEESTLPALETYGPGGQWLVRVVPNLYPAFDGNAPDGGHPPRARCSPRLRPAGSTRSSSCPPTTTRPGPTSPRPTPAW